MTEKWTDQDEQELKKLRRRKAKHIRDETRQRKFTPRLRSSLSENQTTGEKK
jgi:hypothetical protein